jgi:hypothetical protein
MCCECAGCGAPEGVEGVPGVPGRTDEGVDIPGPGAGESIRAGVEPIIDPAPFTDDEGDAGPLVMLNLELVLLFKPGDRTGVDGPCPDAGIWESRGGGAALIP